MNQQVRTETSELPLSGTTVIELASVLAGPSIGMFLAELGATVIKVENSTTAGDVTRSWRLPSESQQGDISAYFSCVNWGKSSLAVNLRTQEGQQIIHALASKADIVIASYKPGDAEKLHVDYPTLSAINPGLIYTHITGYGLENKRAGYDALIQAESGFTSMNGTPDGVPTKMPVALMDLLAAHQAKEGILLALLAKEKGRPGRYIGVSLLQAAAASLANQAANWLVGGQIPKRMGSDHPNIVPYGTIFSTKDDRQIVLAIGSDKQFRELCIIIEDPELADNAKYATNPVRVRERAALCAILQKKIRNWNQDDLLQALHAKAVPAGAVNDMAQVCELPEVSAMLLDGTATNGQRLRAIRSVAFDVAGAQPRDDIAAPPHYGEHTRAVLRDMLQYTDEAIQTLHERTCIYAPGEGTSTGSR